MGLEDREVLLVLRAIEYDLLEFFASNVNSSCEGQLFDPVWRAEVDIDRVFVSLSLQRFRLISQAQMPGKQLPHPNCFRLLELADKLLV